MVFTPEKYSIEDRSMQPFIDPVEIDNLIKNTAKPSLDQVREVVERSMNKKRLSMQEVALLIAADYPEAVELIKNSAAELKQRIYGNRIVLFAPLYIGNKCSNNCLYCGFRSSNKDSVRNTLTEREIIKEVEALENDGQKRLILVFGEHTTYSPQFIADCVRTTYGVKSGKGEIRRVNINAAPLEIEGFKTVKEAGIGTYQVFQETYHAENYKKFHLAGKKSDFNYRLTSLDRAMEAGIDDVGIGALFGLYDWRFELLGLIRHTNHLEACYGVGPHTISFPRIQNASNLDKSMLTPVGDADFLRLVAILRLAVPYTGLIMTARESATLRNSMIKYGVSQIDAGTKLEIGGYSADKSDKTEQDINKEQFEASDTRSLAEIVDELTEHGYVASFCTACYRKGRTGEHFMEFSTKGFIKRFCAPNAILTFAEYLEDYASPAAKTAGYKRIEEELKNLRLSEERVAAQTVEKLEQIKNGERDILF